MKATDRVTGLTAREVRQRFDYDPREGLFRYRIVPPNQSKIKIGDIAGFPRRTKYGVYLIIKINSRPYYAHRLVWLYVFGDWPIDQLDHKDGNKLNNKLDNLRPATQSNNKSNGKRYNNNTSGFKGVVKCKNKWKAQITHQGKVIYLGLYMTKLDAHAAYVRASRELQGEFCKTD